MISNKRKQHIFAVASLMKEKAPLLGLDANEMYLLGYLHDIGYESDESATHNITGGNLLKQCGYKYFNEVYYHGNPFSNYSSKELDLLNYCDMHIDCNGSLVTFNERLEDIKSRHGENSSAYNNAKIVANNLLSKNFLSETK